MQQLKQKIKDTTLFSDEDKIAILAAVDSYASDDISALEAIIDEFDTKHKEATSEYKSSVYGVLGQIVENAKPQEKKRFHHAASTIRSGVDMLVQ